MPFRDPAERMLKVGHGFSKMLSQLKPESINKSDIKQIRPASGRNLSLDPDIGRNNNMQYPSSSLIDINKAEGAQIASTSKLKVSKIKVSKRAADQAISDLHHTLNSHMVTKGSQLPKLE